MCKTHENRICETKSCINLGRNVGKNKDGTIKRANICEMHFGIKHQVNGWQYKVFRKDFCENTDGRLGFICTTTITDVIPKECQLDADHIDGNPANNQIENLRYTSFAGNSQNSHHHKMTQEKKDLAIKMQAIGASMSEITRALNVQYGSVKYFFKSLVDCPHFERNV